MIKKIFAALLAVSTICIFGACNKDNTKTPDPTPNPDVTDNADNSNTADGNSDAEIDYTSDLSTDRYDG